MEPNYQKSRTEPDGKKGRESLSRAMAIAVYHPDLI